MVTGTSARAVIYARYSSDAQSGASIDDQVWLCREHLAREGWRLEQVYRDAALSGASTLRPGYQALLEGAREAAFDVALAESLDRLSRDQEDVAALFKRLRFAGIRLVTLAEGEITELHVGLKGTMNALFLKDLAEKTRRGLRGRVETGASAGGRAYGYQLVNRLDAAGNPVRGGLCIDEDEARVVRQIFERFVGGESPIAIARALNRAATPGPFGQAWRDTTIRGHALRGTGILRNSLYAGRRVWNRMRFIKDPTTGKRVSRLNPADAWIVRDVPELRIIDQETWDRAHERLAGIRARFGADNPDRNRFWERRRAQHLLSGKIFCSRCGGTVSNMGRDYLGCALARRQGNCDNRITIRRSALDEMVLHGLRTRLMAPDLMAEFVAGFTEEWNRRSAERSRGRAVQENELAAVTKKLHGLIDALADGFRAPGLQAQLDELEARKQQLEAALAIPASPAPALHPNLAEVYRERVARLHEALRNRDAKAALEAARELIDRVVITPPAMPGGPPQIELIGALSAMLRLGNGGKPVGDRDLFESSVKVVAGARNHLDLLLIG